MGKKAIVKYLQFLTIIISFVALILTIIGLYGGDVNPTGNEMKALLAFGLPILIIINVVILIYWIIRLKIWVIIPIVSLLICWNYIGTIFRFDSRPDGADTEPGIIIASYNVAAFQHEITGYKAYGLSNEEVGEGNDGFRSLMMTLAQMEQPLLLRIKTYIPTLLKVLEDK